MSKVIPPFYFIFGVSLLYSINGQSLNRIHVRCYTKASCGLLSGNRAVNCTSCLNNGSYLSNSRRPVVQFVFMKKQIRQTGKIEVTTFLSFIRHTVHLTLSLLFSVSGPYKWTEQKSVQLVHGCINTNILLYSLAHPCDKSSVQTCVLA